MADLNKEGYNNLDQIYFPLWHWGIVTRIDDPYNAGRIKVRVDGIDKKLDLPSGLKDNYVRKGFKEEDDAALPWCEPFLPKYINVIPQVGDFVKVGLFDYRNNQVNRHYIGPVVGQLTPNSLLNPKYSTEKVKVLNHAYSLDWTKLPNTTSKDFPSWGVYPSKRSIGILGRINTDIILNDTDTQNQVILRAGKITNETVKTDKPKLNEENPSYVTINFSKVGDNKNVGYINIVSNKINLISHEGSMSKEKGFNGIISSQYEKQKKIEDKHLHPLVYGDKFWEFLNFLYPYIVGHIHKGSRREPDGDESKNDLVNWLQQNMGTSKPEDRLSNDFKDCTFLSKGVKTN